MTGAAPLRALQPRRRALAFAALALLFAIAAVGGQPSGRPPARHVDIPRPLVDLSAALLLVALLAAAVVVAIVLRPQRRGDDDDESDYPPPPPMPLWLRILAPAVPLLVFAAFLVALHSLRPHNAPPPQPLSPARPISGATTAAPKTHGDPIDPLQVLGMAAAIGAAALTAMGVMARRRRTTELELPQVAPAATDEEIDAAAERDPRRGVLLAYAAMEQALRRQGWTRRSSESPREYSMRAKPAPRGSALRLTRLFERARYSAHPIAEEDRSAALAALEDVRSSEPRR